MNTKILVKRFTSSAKLPKKSTSRSVGFDIYVDRVEYDFGCMIIYTGIAVQPPDGYYFDLIPRSSLSASGLIMANSIGVIDPDYSKEIQVRLRPIYGFRNGDMLCQDYYIKTPVAGDRIAQLVLRKDYSNMFDIEPVEYFSEETDRGGFGSTGK